MAINIPLLDGWVLRSDPRNIILCKTEGQRDVEIYYYATITGALEDFCDKIIKRFDATTIQILMKQIKSLSTALSKALHPLKLRIVGAEEAGK